MNQESIDFLDKHRFFFDKLEREGTINNIGFAEKEGFLNVIRKEFSPGYMVNLYCGNCIVDMIRFVYTQYDKAK